MALRLLDKLNVFGELRPHPRSPHDLIHGSRLLRVTRSQYFVGRSVDDIDFQIDVCKTAVGMSATSTLSKVALTISRACTRSD